MNRLSALHWKVSLDLKKDHEIGLSLLCCYFFGFFSRRSRRAKRCTPCKWYWKFKRAIFCTSKIFRRLWRHPCAIANPLYNVLGTNKNYYDHMTFTFFLFWQHELLYELSLFLFKQLLWNYNNSSPQYLILGSYLTLIYRVWP